MPFKFTRSSWLARQALEDDHAHRYSEYREVTEHLPELGGMSVRLRHSAEVSGLTNSFDNL